MLEQIDDVLSRLCTQLATTPQLKVVPWASVASALAAILTEYPTGVTWPLAMAGVQRSLLDRKEEASAPPAMLRTVDMNTDSQVGLSAQDAVRRRQRLSFLQGHTMLDFSCAFDVRLESVQTIAQAFTTLIAVLRDVTEDVQDRSTARVQMYLHEKFYFLGHPGEFVHLFVTDIIIRMTGCRLVDMARVGVPRILPTDLVILGIDCFSTTGGQFLKHHFGSPCVPEQFDADQRGLVCLSVNVVDVSVVHQIGRRKRVAVYLRPVAGHASLAARFERFILQLWDDQTLFSSLIARGDVLHIYRPYVSTSSGKDMLLLEYGSATVLFMSINAPQQPDVHEEPVGVISQAVARDNQDTIDCHAIPNRVYLAELRQLNHANLCLLAWVVSVDRDNETLFLSDTSSQAGVQSPFALRLVGFDQVSVAAIAVGSVCIIEGIVCGQDADGSMRAVCSRLSGGRVTVLDLLTGVLNSPFTYEALPLRALNRQIGHAAVVAGSISQWTLADGAPVGDGGDTVRLIHSPCGISALLNKQNICSVCGASSPDAASACLFNLAICLDDGFSTVLIGTGQRPTTQLLGLSAAAFLRCQPDQRLKLLGDAISFQLVATVIPTQHDVVSFCMRAVDSPPPAGVSIQQTKMLSSQDSEFVLSGC